MTDPATDQMLRAVYQTGFVAAAERLRAAGVSFFPLAPDPAVESYYSRRETRSDYISDYDSSRFSSELLRRWREEGSGELSDLAGELGQLAQRLESVDVVSGDVSPFIYAMF